MPKVLIFGVHAVESAVRNDPSNIGQIWIDKDKRNSRLQKCRENLHHARLPVTETDSNTLDKMASVKKHQGIIAEYFAQESRNENELEILLESLDEPPFLLVLDGVTDPHNLGACLRTADAVGIHAVIAPKDGAVGLTPAVRKVASGAAESVPFFAVTNLSRTLDKLKMAGLWLIGTADKSEQALFDCDLRGPIAVVMGAEGSGIRRLTAKQCDFLIRIPMAGQISNLNVSVATGVCLYEAFRQRQH